MKSILEILRSLGGLGMFGLLIFVACVGGWIANIVKLFMMLGGDVSAMFIMRIVGMFTVLPGIVLGYL